MNIFSKLKRHRKVPSEFTLDICCRDYKGHEDPVESDKNIILVSQHRLGNTAWEPKLFMFPLTLNDCGTWSLAVGIPIRISMVTMRIIAMSTAKSLSV